MRYDAIIVGGGPAGLTAALYLGRYLRPTLLLDRPKPDSPWFLPTSHNFLLFPDGLNRTDLLRIGRAHVAEYPAVTLREAAVTRLTRLPDGFAVHTDTGEVFAARGVILATGSSYELPDLPNIMAYAGRTIHHCPECDGYAARNCRLLVMGVGRATAGFALKFKVWTDDITLCTQGEDPTLDRESQDKLARAGVRVITEPVVELEGDPEAGQVSGVVLQSGERLAVDRIFTNYACQVFSDMVAGLGVELGDEGHIKVDKHQQTNIHGLYAAGDVDAPDHKQLVIAMGDGATAAINLHYALLPEELSLEETVVKSYEDEGWLPPMPDQLPPQQQTLPQK